MSINMMQTISLGAFVLAGIFALGALILWFTLGVRGIIDDLSGRKAERQMKELREQNVQTQMADRKNTGRKNERTSQLTVPLAVYKAETVYFKEAETALLPEKSTTVLHTKEGATVPGAEEVTTVLLEEEVTLQSGCRLVLNEIVVHTKEVIG